jgi:hypothetical protein
MSLKKRLGTMAIYVMLEIGALSGVPFRPDQIEQLMNVADTKIVQITREANGDPEEPEEKEVADALRGSR